MSEAEPPLWWWSTANAPGAIAVAHVHGPAREVERFLEVLCGRAAPRRGEVAWRRFGAVDDGVVARTGECHALVMPHGGPRIRALLDARATELGARAATAQARLLHEWPEAADEVERAMLSALARAASPMAIDLLAAQPARWRAVGVDAFAQATPDDRDRRLRRLIDPARVVVTGPANAGKSTLLNALAGREVAIEHDMPGTTRDSVAARIDLAGVVVDWFDTPGARDGMDDIERAAALLAARALASADLVVELTAPGLGWRTLDGAPASAVRIRALNQADRPDAAGCPESSDAALRISARTGHGVTDLVAAVRDALVPPADLRDPRPWRFA